MKSGTLSARLGGSGRNAAWRLVLISFLSLYFELTFIRWTPIQLRLLAYFVNYVLIAALLGLGLGMLLASRPRRLVLYFPPALLALTALVLLLERVRFVIPIVSEGQFVWNYLADMPARGLLSYVVLVGFFLSLVALFMLIGQEVGRALQPFRPLAAYSLNIFGSLLGVAAFALVSYLEEPPPLWFAIGVVGLLLYLFGAAISRRWLLVATASLAIVVALVSADTAIQPAGVARHWSPYYEIEVKPFEVNQQQLGYNVIVNKDSHQQALDLSDRYAAEPFVAGRQRLYDLPYQFVQPRRILVVGAGTGNDVAAALRNAPGATVDAVEIDPVIARLGRSLHPERPYDDPNVRVHIDDARSFLHKSDAEYDLIVFGFLDSHRLFSQMSSVRMDNYVYTRENFARVREHLAPGGVVAVTFTVHEQWIADRIFTVMEHVFDRRPLVYQGNAHAWGTTFLAGASDLELPPGAQTLDHATFRAEVLEDRERITWRYSDVEGFVDPGAGELSTRSILLTDDWPFLYMRSRSVPANYLLVLLLTVVASLALIWRVVPRIDFHTSTNWNFLLLGAAFALLETRGITEIALVFGSTWITNSIVIGAILLMILLANLVVARTRTVRLEWVYVALFATLLVNYLVPLHGLLEYGFWTQVLVSGVRVAGPLFFSGIIFARWFERVGNPSSALGANLIGAVLGGLLEYGSLAVGLRQLYLLALVFYGLSFVLAYGGISLRRLVSPKAAAG